MRTHAQGPTTVDAHVPTKMRDHGIFCNMCRVLLGTSSPGRGPRAGLIYADFTVCTVKSCTIWTDQIGIQTGSSRPDPTALALQPVQYVYYYSTCIPRGALQR